MKVYLIRHAHAVEGKNDAKRRLSPRGKAQIRTVGSFLKRARILGADEFWHSPLVRSRETAKRLVARMGRRAKLREVSGLLHDDNPAIMARRLGAVRKPVAVVGHEPHLSALASLLVAGKAKPSLFEFRKCAVVELEGSRKTWRVCWQIAPAMLP